MANQLQIRNSTAEFLAFVANQDRLHQSNFDRFLFAESKNCLDEPESDMRGE